MTPKQERFVDEYLIDWNAAQAAIRAGYSPKAAKEIGYENLTKPHIIAAIGEKSGEIQRRVEINQDYVLETIHETVERCKAPGEAFQPHAILKGTDQLGKHLRMWGDDKDSKRPPPVVIVMPAVGQAEPQEIMITYEAEADKD